MAKKREPGQGGGPGDRRREARPAGLRRRLRGAEQKRWAGRMGPVRAALGGCPGPGEPQGKGRSLPPGSGGRSGRRTARRGAGPRGAGRGGRLRHWGCWGGPAAAAL